MNHPSLRAAIEHAHAGERLPDGRLDCVECFERAPHGTLEGHTNWRCRCRMCIDGATEARRAVNTYSSRKKYFRGYANSLQKFKADQKIDKTCADCGLICTLDNYPAFDWDHLPGKVKLFSLSQAQKSQATLLSEIAKCELVCAFCHRLRTHHRGYINQLTPTQ